MKGTCVFFGDWFTVAQEIADEKLRCSLYDAILRFALEGTDTPTLPAELALLFASIKLQINRANEQYFEICSKRSAAGRRGAQVTNEIRWGKSAKSANADSCQQTSANISKVNYNDNNNRKQNEKIDNAAHAASIEQRKQAFYESLLPYRSQFGADLLQGFFEYWTESNKSNTKLRFEIERTFEVGKRLARWARNDNNFKNRQA